MTESTRAGGRAAISGLIRKLSGRPAAHQAMPSGTKPLHADGSRIYAIGDIHGRLDLLLRLEDLIRSDLVRHPEAHSILVTLGDYIDRGAQSREVIEHLSAPQNICSEHAYLRGNHEEVLLEFLRAADVLDAWSRFGGLETLVSYGLRPSLPLTAEIQEALRLQLEQALPPHHLAFLQTTRLSFETRTHYFAHAGINPAFNLAQQKPQDLLWIRDEFLSSSRKFEKIIVHGHTPAAAPEILPNRINVDTGAYITGKLTCAVIEGKSCRILST